MTQIDFLKYIYYNTDNEKKISWNLDESTGDVYCNIGKVKITIYSNYIIIAFNNSDSKTYLVKPESEKYVDKIRDYVKKTKEEEFLEFICTNIKKELK